MINSISNTSPVHHWQLELPSQASAVNKPKPSEPQDSVVLSKVATGQVDADHDGDSR